MSQVSSIKIQDFTLWQKMDAKRALYSFDLDLTARCNLNCRHCYINLPAGDAEAKARELSLKEIADLADQARELGAMWCLLTGGEPLLRADFNEIYMMLKRKGLLISLFTNATLIRPEHIELFKKYPPRDIEVTIYGASVESYERVTRRPGSFSQFVAGIDALFSAGIRVRLKAMALRSNLQDMEAIAAFGRSRTKDFYRFDPQLHLRYDRDPLRNEEIRSERLTPEEVVALEQADTERFGLLLKGCDELINEAYTRHGCDHQRRAQLLAQQPRARVDGREVEVRQALVRQLHAVEQRARHAVRHGVARAQRQVFGFSVRDDGHAALLLRDTS